MFAVVITRDLERV